MSRREQIKQLESVFLKTAQQTLPKIGGNMQKLLLDLIKKCQNYECLQKGMPLLKQISKQTNRKLQFIGNQVQHCIRKQSNIQGLDGYAKCFTMFQKYLRWQANQPHNYNL